MGRQSIHFQGEIFMKKNVSRFFTGLCIASLFIVASCFVGVQTAHAQVAAMVLQSNGTTLQKTGQHLLSGQQTANGFLGQADSCGSGYGNAAWVNYIGRQNSLGFVGTNQEVLGQALDIDSYGVQLGTDLYRSRRSQFGVLFDYEGFITSFDGNDLLESDNFSGGIYYAHVFANNSDFRALAKFGTSQHHAVGDTHKVDSDSFNAVFEYGKRYFPVQNISLRPYAAFDVNYAYLGADEVADVAFRGTKLSQTYFRVGTDLIAQIRRFTVKADISYSVDLVSGRLDVWTNDLGNVPGWRNDDLHIGRQIASVGLTGQYDFNRRNALFASFGLDAFFDRDSRPYQSTGVVGYSLVW